MQFHILVVENETIFHGRILDTSPIGVALLAHPRC